MKDFEKNLEKYAELTIKTAVNLQRDQVLVITAPIETAEFVRITVKSAYQAGAKYVHVQWKDQEISLIKFKHAAEDALKYYPQWLPDGLTQMGKEGAAFLVLTSSNPDLMKGIDPQKIAVENRTEFNANKELMSLIMGAKANWAVVPVPSPGWSAKVFPHLETNEAQQKLWHHIFEVNRIYNEDPQATWREHVDSLKAKLRYLNDKKYKKLHYKAAGTDLTVELSENQLWTGGGLQTDKGLPFVANMPTEEVFTVPMREGVNGTVQSTRPLNHKGSTVDNFSLTFENGRIVSYEAEKGIDVLKNLIETDEGSHYLGEVALVPVDSPISRSDITFYNTLFDENASSHFAIGTGYSFCLEGGQAMSPEEQVAAGINQSLLHVDFMVGSQDMSIDGETADGTLEAIFRNGNWA
ncbi:MAG: aminopeptidase [bacterium]|nr:aminopeptidase [bacterium]